MTTEGRHRRGEDPEVPWYESRRRVRRWPVWLGPAVAVVGVLMLAAGAVLFGSSAVPRRVAGSSTCDGPKATATIAASPDAAPVLRRIAALWSLDQPKVGATCAEVAVTAADSAAVAAVIGGQGTADVPGRPDVWAPESSAWAALATVRPEAAAAIPRGAWLSLATTPVVLAVPKDRAAALGWPKKPVSLSAVLAGLRDDPTWGRYGHREWGPVVIGMGDVTRSTADLHTLLALTDGNRNGRVDPAEIANELLLERSVGKYAKSTTELFALAAKGAPIAAFPATEQQVLAWNTASEGRQLVPVHPAEGIAGADHPYVTLQGDWVTPQARQVAYAFSRFVLGPVGRAEFARAGFRDRDRSPTGIPAAADERLVPARFPTRAIMGPGPAAQALVRWRALRRPANVLATIDTSGSMADPAPGLAVTKLAVFQQAAVQAVSLFNAQSRLGIWEFSSKLTPTSDYRAVLPARPLGATVAPGVTQREAVFGAVRAMRPAGATGLYDTIDASYREVNRIWRKDQQNILVVMTDGKNEDTAGLSLQELVRRLKTTRNADRPVTVILIAYGQDADVASLSQAAAATGGRTYVALRPTDIGKVFLAAMVNR